MNKIGALIVTNLSAESTSSDAVSTSESPLEHYQALPGICAILDGFMIAPPHIRHFRVDGETGDHFIGDVSGCIKSLRVIIGEFSI
ncbi:hypothetical protein D9M68_867930 [compost metagenome]